MCSSNVLGPDRSLYAAGCTVDLCHHGDVIDQRAEIEEEMDTLKAKPGL